jgi:hypothetical protein
MSEINYSIKISPEVISGDIFKVSYLVAETTEEKIPFCCDILTQEISTYVDANAYVYSSMTQVLSGGTNGSSLLTGLTIPILITENTIDIGYYSVFDGMVLQKDTMINFIFTGNNNTYSFYNTSDTEFKKYLEFSTYTIDWGDNETTVINPSLPNFYSHTYFGAGEYTITMKGVSPWGTNIISKKVITPFTGTTISNPNGNAVFVPAGGNWSATPISYNFIFSGDSNCDSTVDDINLFNPPGTIPFLITGYTTSSLTDLKQYGTPQYKVGVSVTGNTDMVGIYHGSVDNNNLFPNGGGYSSYTINDIDYYDFSDGTTLFVVESSGLTSDMVVCNPIVKNELLLGIIDEAEIQSNIFIERGKNSALESIERLGEVDNLGDLVKYGYKFFNVINTI